MRLSFLGACRQVTGSRYLLDSGGRRLLIDCGLFQERPSLDRNWEPFPVPAESLDAVLLTHAHLDHCGYLPRLAAEGFEGPVFATAATADLARIVLLDAAKIMTEDADFKRKRHEREGRRGPHPEIPLYTTAEVEACLPLLTPVEYGRPVRPAPGLRALYRDAGHILGSAMVEVEAREGEVVRRLVFSGDIGQWGAPLVKDPTVFPRADAVVMESTYGDREHVDPEPADDLLARAIVETAARGGHVVVPVFAVERAQEILFRLSRLLAAGRIPRLPVFLDSPMAVEVTALFRRYAASLDPEFQAQARSAFPPFDFPGLRLLRTMDESRALASRRDPSIILAGSGMATGGRIKTHLADNIERPESTILFVGYQAPQTLGRQILDGAPEVRILGRMRPVRARIERIEGFSGHAGRSGLLRWLGGFRERPARLFLTHGEEEASLDLARALEADGWNVVVPRYKDEFELA